jgi:hypothetical protein
VKNFGSDLLSLLPIIRNSVPAPECQSASLVFYVQKPCATQYANSSLFIAKMVIVVAGAANALVLNLAMPDDRSLSHWTTSRLPARVRSAACISFAAWLSALTLGRLVGYF